MDKIEVSVIIVTYNHEKYIDTAIKSVVSQKTNFQFEIIICDDCSTDNTEEIINKYAELDNITIINNYDNIGNTKNTLNGIKKARGEFYVVLEGDDYWLSDSKLQKQYDILKNNNELIGVSHKICEMNVKKEIVVSHPKWVNVNTIITLNDFLKFKLYSNVATMYRNVWNSPSAELEELFTCDKMICDLQMCIIALTKGNIMILNENLSVYRTVTLGNISNYNSKKSTFEKAKTHIYLLNKLNEYYPNLDFKYHYNEWLFILKVSAIIDKRNKEFKEIINIVKDDYIKNYRKNFILKIFEHRKKLLDKIMK